VRAGPGLPEEAGAIVRDVEKTAPEAEKAGMVQGVVWVKTELNHIIYILLAYVYFTGSV